MNTSKPAGGDHRCLYAQETRKEARVQAFELQNLAITLTQPDHEPTLTRPISLVMAARVRNRCPKLKLCLPPSKQHQLCLLCLGHAHSPEHQCIRSAVNNQQPVGLVDTPHTRIACMPLMYHSMSVALQQPQHPKLHLPGDPSHL